MRDGCGGFEDRRGVGEEAAVPEVGAAAFEDVDVVALEVEAEGGTGFVFAVDGDEVSGVDLRGDLLGELGGGEDRREGLKAEVGGEEEAEGSGGEREVGGVGFGCAFAEKKRGERAGEEARSREGQREAEEAEGLRVEVEKVAHAEGVVAGVLGEEGGEVGVGGGGLGVEEEVDGSRRRRGYRGPEGHRGNVRWRSDACARLEDGLTTPTGFLARANLR